MRQDAGAVRSLLKGGADVNAAQGDGMTALHWAAIHGDVPLARSLVAAGARVSATTRLGGFTPLHLASQYRLGAHRRGAPRAGRPTSTRPRPPARRR